MTPSSTEGALLTARLAAHPDAIVQVIGFAAHPAAGIVVGPSSALLDRMLARIGAPALRDRLARTPLGRLLNSLGPLDQGRVFWRAIRRHPEGLRALREADAVYAVDLSAVKAGWIAVHRRWVAEAYYDHAGAGYLAEASTTAATRAATAASDTADAAHPPRAERSSGEGPAL